MDGFYIVNTEKFFNTITKDLKSSGYEWIGVNKNPTFLECKKQIHGNAKLIIHAFIMILLEKMKFNLEQKEYIDHINNLRE